MKCFTCLWNIFQKSIYSQDTQATPEKEIVTAQPEESVCIVEAPPALQKVISISSECSQPLKRVTSVSSEYSERQPLKKVTSISSDAGYRASIEDNAVIGHHQVRFVLDPSCTPF